ncbi:MAG TPA: zf-HC2 domain-containing protein [Solirubrobacteraceae bacterium]|jgi:anti-sigma factor RsiW
MSSLLHTVRFRLDHRWAPRRMSEYLDGELAGAARRRLDGHLTECEECARLLAGLRRMVETLHAAPAAVHGADAAKLAAAVRGQLS